MCFKMLSGFFFNLAAKERADTRFTNFSQRQSIFRPKRGCILCSQERQGHGGGVDCRSAQELEFASAAGLSCVSPIVCFYHVGLFEEVAVVFLCKREKFNKCPPKERMKIII